LGAGFATEWSFENELPFDARYVLQGEHDSEEALERHRQGGEDRPNPERVDEAVAGNHQAR
jgi:hypothetical protein